MRSCGGRDSSDTVIDKTVEAVEKSISDAEKKIIAANEKSASIKTTTDSITGSTRSTLAGTSWIKLASGKEIEVPEGSLIDRLYVYLSGGSGEANSRFTFDNLFFQTGTANIALKSANQVQNVADILNAFSNSRIRIEAHTENVGEPIANKTLSEQRALAVKFALSEMGVANERIDAVGLGDTQPIVINKGDADSPENRRVEIFVTRR
jgi:K(+)-stimulated pyrophosphate-energized sodium pump